MRRARRSDWSRHAVALSLGAVLAGCAAPLPSAPPDDVAPRPQPLQAFETLDEARGPWRAEPIALDPVLERRIIDGCRRELLGLERQMPAAEGTVVDVRGEGLAVVALVFPNGGDAGCIGLTIDHGGGTGMAYGLWGADLDPLPAPARGELHVATQGDVFIRGRPPGRAVVGQVDEAIAHVVVEPAKGGRVVASVGHGRFLAWWPEAGVDGTNSSIGRFRVVGMDPQGRALFSCVYGPGDPCLDHALR